jgi:non-specific protein-tyrosine kinase
VGIAFSLSGDPPHALLVTSSTQGEGKSMIAANLAAAFAESGKRVILVDFDLRRPSVESMFQVSGPGLTSLLTNEHVSPESCLVYTREANLMVLPSGALPTNPAELVGSRRLAQVMDRLRALADIIVVDSPPFLAVADAALAAQLCDASVLVVRPDRVRRRSLVRSMELLNSLGSPVLGVIVNGFGAASDRYYTSEASGRGQTRHRNRADRNGHREDRPSIVEETTRESGR